MDVRFDPEEESIVCETCGTELPAFLDACPYCDDDDVTQPCPSCGADIHYESEQCPACGDWVVMRAGEGGPRRGWTLFLVLAVIVLVLLAIRLHG